MVYKDDTPELGEYVNPYPKNSNHNKKLINDSGFIVDIEGLDGSGKSTQTQMLCEKLIEAGYKVYSTNFIHSSYIKQILLKTKWENCDVNTFTLMYSMGLSYVYNTEIIKKLNEGYVVVLDRYIYTIIVKSLIGGADRTWAEHIMNFFKVPNVRIYIDTPVEECLRRKRSDNVYLSYWECGGNVFNEDSMRFEYSDEMFSEFFIKYQQMARKEYLFYAENNDWHIIDGKTHKEEINEILLKMVIEELEKGGIDHDYKH